MIILTNQPAQVTKSRSGKFEVVYLDSRNSVYIRYAIKKYIVNSDKDFLIIADSEASMRNFRIIADVVIE